MENLAPSMGNLLDISEPQVILILFNFLSIYSIFSVKKSFPIETEIPDEKLRMYESWVSLVEFHTDTAACEESQEMNVLVEQIRLFSP